MPEVTAKTAPAGLRLAPSGWKSREMSLFVIIIVVCVLLTIVKGGIFFSAKNFEGVATGMTYDLFMAAGMTIVLILWGIDLSVGAVLALTTVITAMMLQSGIAIPIAVLLGLVFAALAGAVNGFFITKLRVAPFIVTLAVMSIARGTALVLSSGYFLSGLPASYSFISEGRVWGIPIPYITVIVVLVSLHFLLTRWKFLNQSFFVGTNPEAATLAGLNTAKITIVGYMICALMAGFAAIFMSSKLWGLLHGRFGQHSGRDSGGDPHRRHQQWVCSDERFSTLATSGQRRDPLGGCRR